MSKSLEKLISVMRRLRDRENGCPWDLEQDHKSLARYTLEEAYEVVEAIESGDKNHLVEELGDLLLQIVFHAQLGAEIGAFDFDQIAEIEAEKMIERHPHVFGDVDVSGRADVLRNWEVMKAQKRAAEALKDGRAASALDGVNTALPALSRALKLCQRAARAGFDWTEPQPFMAKIREEIGEFEHEITQEHGNPDAMEDELGDVIFAVIGLAHFMGLDPERALRRTNAKFERRFRGIEDALAAQGRTMADAKIEEMEAIWRQVKSQEP